jgi:hypothetical protein
MQHYTKNVEAPMFTKVIIAISIIMSSIAQAEFENFLTHESCSYRISGTDPYECIPAVPGDVKHAYDLAADCAAGKAKLACRQNGHSVCSVVYKGPGKAEHLPPPFSGSICTVEVYVEGN